MGGAATDPPQEIDPRCPHGAAPQCPRRARARPFHAGVALVLTLGLGAALLLLFRLPWSGFALLACWLAAINVVAFGYYGYDKSRAQRSRSRVPEMVLHGIA